MSAVGGCQCAGQSWADTVAAAADLLVFGEWFEGPVFAVLVPDTFDHVVRWEPLSAVGEPDIVEKLKEGHTANGKEFRVHLDGYDQTAMLTGEGERARDQIFYFSADGELNAVRWNDWKVHFAIYEGNNIAESTRVATTWPTIINLRADPFEEMWEESGMYLRWYGDQMWLFVPIQEEVQKFLATMEGYPFQEGATLNASGINYQSLKAAKILEQIREKGLFEPSFR